MNGNGIGNPSDEKPSTVQWLELPEGIWGNILQRLGPLEILLTAQKVCTAWRRICKDPSMWRVVDLYNFGNFNFDERTCDLGKMCRHVIDLSQGQVQFINLSIFATVDDLLLYLAERARRLKELSIAFCMGKVCKVLDEVVRKLPLLEELSVTHTTLPEGFFKTFLGDSCPKWKYKIFTGASDEEALAIAKNLPALRHLQLIWNNMTNEGLEAILNGCPHLVSLDLRQCRHVSINADLTKRISRQIKDVKHPYDKSLDGVHFAIRVYTKHNMSDDICLLAAPSAHCQ